MQNHCFDFQLKFQLYRMRDETEFSTVLDFTRIYLYHFFEALYLVLHEAGVKLKRYRGTDDIGWF